MGTTCQDCGTHFKYLEKPICHKCEKLNAAPDETSFRVIEVRFEPLKAMSRCDSNMNTEHWTMQIVQFDMEVLQGYTMRRLCSQGWYVVICTLSR